MTSLDNPPIPEEAVPTESPPKTSRRCKIILLIGIVVCSGVLTWLIYAVQAAQETVRCLRCQSHLKQLELGLKQFELATGGLPPAYLCDEKGKPIHSWQSLLKPYLGYYGWRQTYSIKEPWDGPTNHKLHSHPDHSFQCPNLKNRSRLTVDYVAVVGPDTMWPGRDRVKLPAEDDGNQDTILLIEMPDSDYNAWEPRSPTVEEFMDKIKSPTGKGIRCIHPKGLAYVTIGGDGRWFPPDTNPETIRQLLKRPANCQMVSLSGMMPLIEHWGEEGTK